MTPPIKVAMIGAGSVVFSKNLTCDILGYPEFREAAFCYMDVDPRRLEVGAALCRKAAKAVGANPTILATQDRREALAGADFVINMVQIGGFDSTLVDFEIPRKYGLNFTIADTTGPGGLFRALRTYPMLTGLCRDMREVCPNGWLLNYSNPMSMNMQTISRTSGVRAVGLCHSVQGTLDELMGYLGEKSGDIAFVCAGINHMAFYLRLEKNGQDLYPRLFEAMNNAKIYNTNKVRFELMKRLGYFVTESSEHNAEYSPYFIPHGPRQIAAFDVPIDEYLRRCENIVGEFERLAALGRTDEPIDVRRSREYGSTIIHSIVTGTPAVVYGNMPNRGAISNLPADAIAEAPTLVDRGGPRFTTVGELPPQLVGYMQPHVTQHELFIRAAMEGRRDYLYQAAMFDPLTAALLPLDKIVELCDELIAAHGPASQGGVLPDLDCKKTLVPGSGKSFSRANLAELREQRCAAVKSSLGEYIRDWHVIGPFPAGEGNRDGLELPTPVEQELQRSPDGSVNPRQQFDAAGRLLHWQHARADARGFVNLAAALCGALGGAEWAVAYAYAQVESGVAREVVLRCGSDDGIMVWMNGQVVHLHEVGRAYTPDSDRFLAELKAGINHIVVKIDNYTSGWGFGLAVAKENI
ncbi:MAG TPA: alpha-glucosidase/alpha-galactosidase [Tepidisphaeraceae bacterium]|nr:alpha-glucosidase/alpha-galactosidase [Tepidisphaeraceae bacterium]